MPNYEDKNIWPLMKNILEFLMADPNDPNWSILQTEARTSFRTLARYLFDAAKDTQKVYQTLMFFPGCNSIPSLFDNLKTKNTDDPGFFENV